MHPLNAHTYVNIINSNVLLHFIFYTYEIPKTISLVEPTYYQCKYAFVFCLSPSLILILFIFYTLTKIIKQMHTLKVYILRCRYWFRKLSIVKNVRCLLTISIIKYLYCLVLYSNRKDVLMESVFFFLQRNNLWFIITIPFSHLCRL